MIISPLLQLVIVFLFLSCHVNGDLTKKTKCKPRDNQGSISSNSTIGSKNGPTVYLFGDSTMSTCRSGPIYATETSGWGTPFTSFMSIKVANDALSGYSSRQAYREKIYDQSLKLVQPGDFVIIQWGRNEVSTQDKRPCDVTNGNYETICKSSSSSEPQVYSFVKYLEMAAQAFQQKGANVIIASLTTRSTFQTADGKFLEEVNPFIQQAKIAADLTKSTFVDVHSEMTKEYQNSGFSKVKEFYLPVNSGQKPDFTHTTPKGALVAAQSFLAALAKTTSQLNHYVKQAPSGIAQPVCH